MSAVEMSGVGVVEEFNVSVYVSEQLSRQLVNVSQDVAYRAVKFCAERYHFDAEEACRLLGLAMVKVERKAPVKEKKENVGKASVPKSSFPLPYNGELHENCCFALRQNNGLYTQCTGSRKGGAEFCKSCATTMQKRGADIPEYGTIQMRNAVGIFEYTDPKGRKPISYTKIMKKYNISEEQVLEEAGKLNMTIDSKHFIATEAEVKRGRPKSDKEPKAKGAKGRPKKEKKVVLLEGDDEDLFAALVAEANDEETPDEEIVVNKKKEKSDEEIVVNKKKGKSDEEKEAERLAKEDEKREKEAKRQAEKAEKEAKRLAEKAEKEAKLAAEKEAKKKAEEEAKAAKKAAAELAKKEKEAKKAPKESKKKVSDDVEKVKKESVMESSDDVVADEDDEPERVKTIKFEGKQYLKSRKTGIVYDYDLYLKNGDQVVVGKWNEALKKVEFTAKDESDDEEEEEEEEYDL